MRLLLFLAVASLAIPFTAAAPGDPGDPGGERVVARAFDAEGRLLWEKGYVVDEDGIAFERFYRHADAAKPDNPGNGNGKGGGGGGGGGGDGGSDPGTDCEADQFKAAGWSWSGPFAATADAYVTEFAASAQSWDDATGAAILSGVTYGTGTAGVRDGQNHFSFADLGASSTIAVTTTWYNRYTGEAVESDAQYNAFYSWATDGRAGAMDVQNIATHEIGHSYGLTHPNGPSQKIGCLTMYAYASNGETAKRSLGDGDILGIQALYGA